MTTQPPEDPKQASRQKPSPGSDIRKALALGCTLATACSGAQVRPESFTCPEGARRAMEELGWDSGSNFIITVDDRHDEFADIWVRPGDTVVGVVPKSTARLPQVKVVPPGTRFLGGRVYVWPEKLWDRPGRVLVKYERVKLPQQDEVPVCFVMDMPAEELKDGAAKIPNGAKGWTAFTWNPEWIAR